MKKLFFVKRLHYIKKYHQPLRMSSQDDCSTGNCPNNECFDIVKSKKTVTVPCTRNICESYTVKVPKMKSVTVNKQVPYTDYETRTKQVPYQYLERQTVVKRVPTCRTIPVTKNVCTTIRRKPLAALLAGGRSTYKKNCPRTVYVKKTCCVPRQFCQSVPKTGWKTIQEKVPVQKMKNMQEVQYKTEYVPEVRRRTRQVTKMVTKTVPVYNLVPKPPAPPGEDRVIKTVCAPEPNLILPAQTAVQAVPTVQSNAVQTSAELKYFSGKLRLVRTPLVASSLSSMGGDGEELHSRRHPLSVTDASVWKRTWTISVLLVMSGILIALLPSSSSLLTSSLST